MAYKLKVAMFLGTVRENRLGIRIAKFMQKYLEKTGHEVHFFDPLELDLPLLKKPLFFYPDRDQAPAVLKEMAKTVSEADAILIVSGEYNHSIPPALSNMLDHLPTGVYNWKPSGIVSYSPGLYGGMRAAMQLRSMLGELGCLSVSNIFGIPKAHESFDEDGNPLNDHMEKGAQKLLTQLDWHAQAMKNQRDKFGIPK